MIAIITYNKPHRKTQDLIARLLLKGYKDITVIAMPFKERERVHKPLYEHRPKKCIDIPIKEMCKNLNIKYTEKFNVKYESILIGGAGILPKKIVKCGVINAHPGYLPNVRGLDAFKWAIYHGQPIGVTTHLISEEVDAGYLIDRKIIPIKYTDTFHSVAYRQYELEIEMLVDALGKKVADVIPVYYGVHKRMSHLEEIEMIEVFNRMRIRR